VVRIWDTLWKYGQAGLYVLGCLRLHSSLTIRHNIEATYGLCRCLSHLQSDSREDIRCLQRVGRVIRTKDLLLLALPFRLVDGVDPVLNLHDDASVLLHDAGTSLVSLCRLDGKGA
jgi:hypothetical protein